MKPIQEILDESVKADRTAQILALFHKCSKKYFGGITKKRPDPTIKIGTAYGKFGHYNHAKNELWINKDLFTNERGLKGTVYHETIHFWDFDYPWSEWRWNKGHGKFFVEHMKKINSGENDPTLIDITGVPTEKISATEKEFVVYFWEWENAWRMFWSVKDTEATRNFVIKVFFDKPNPPTEFFVCQTNDINFRKGLPQRPGTTTLSYWKIDSETANQLKKKAKKVPLSLESDKKFVAYIGITNRKDIVFWWDYEENSAVKKAMRLLMDIHPEWTFLKLETNNILWQRRKRLTQDPNIFFMVSSNIANDVKKAKLIDKSDFQ